MQENLDITKNTEGTTETLSLKGRLSIVTSPRLAAEVESVNGDIKTLKIDLADVDYVSSAGIRIIIIAQKKMTAAGGNLEILNPTAEIVQLCDITGLKDVLTIR